MVAYTSRWGRAQRFFLSAQSCLTASTTASALMPSSFMAMPPGALRPKRSMPTTLPSRPTYLLQRPVTPASMATRLRHEGGQLGVQATFCASDRLGRLSAPGIGSVLMELDVGAVQMTQHAHRSPAQHREHPPEQSAGAPEAESAVNGLPFAIALRQVTPSHTGAQDIEHGAKHQPVVLWRSPSASSTGTFCSSRSATAIRSIF